MASTLCEFFFSSLSPHSGLFSVFPGSEHVRPTSCFKWLRYRIIFPQLVQLLDKVFKNARDLFIRVAGGGVLSPGSSDLCTRWKLCNLFLKSASSHSSEITASESPCTHQSESLQRQGSRWWLCWNPANVSSPPQVPPPSFISWCLWGRLFSTCLAILSASSTFTQMPDH